jgi:RHS repeat-associated protein
LLRSSKIKDELLCKQWGTLAAGNMTHDSTSGLNYSYDQENRITGTAGFTYTYDDDGNRVEKTNGSTGTLYWYMTPGVVAESDLAGNLQSEYVFFDGERVARKDFPSNAVSYYFSDHLKTTDIVTDAQGNIKNESDFYPWGGELPFVANDSNHYKFTGKERDPETQLDYFGARYYSSGLGRWISADWSSTPEPVPYADFGDPQTLNLYGYVRGLPTTRADVDGHCCDWQALWDGGTGVVRGFVSSASGGLVGAPDSNDSISSLAGQGIGTILEGAAGMAWQRAAPAMIGGGLAAEPESIGTSTVVVAAGGIGLVAGPLMQVGAAKNAGAILSAMAGRRAGDFKPSTREEAIQGNAQKNGGNNRCEKCGQKLVRTQNKPGKTPPKNQLHVHHNPPIKDGGGKNSKPEVVCRDCHQNVIHGKAKEQR